ncbi:MAG: hypothetical protein P8181_07930 [bacterium]
MKTTSWVVLVLMIVVVGCSDDEPGVEEIVSTPNTPTGPDTAYVGVGETYVSGGAASSEGHGLEYRFDFDAAGNRDLGGWSAATGALKSWSAPGGYVVKAQARCAKHADKVSPWSDGKTVMVIASVSAPHTPSGPASIAVQETGSYYVGGAADIYGGPLEYRFDFDAEGARDPTGWMESDPMIGDRIRRRNSWASPGIYVVKGQARSAAHPERRSAWSNGLIVTVNARFISTPRKPVGPQTLVPSEIGDLYCTGGALSTEGDPIEYQFSVTPVDTPLTSMRRGSAGVQYTDWSSDSCMSYGWVGTGAWEVTARARSSIQTDKVSAWSEGLDVVVGISGDIPEIRFATTITRSDGLNTNTTTRPYNPSAPDTVGMLRPFAISYHGIGHGASIRAYSYFPLTTGIEIEGQDRWSEDLGDTLRYFPVDPGGYSFQSGMFRLAARCLDTNGLVSAVDVGDFDPGVCQIVVNFDPDTEVFGLRNTFFVGGVEHTNDVVFTDAVPDTVPYNSWVRLDYNGWDSPYDSSLCTDDVNKCLGYQIQYSRDSARLPGAKATSRWLPDDPEDGNPFGTTDSTSMNIGSVEYVLRARSVDEYGRPDGTPYEIPLVGNFNPTLDSYELQNYTGDLVSGDDTLEWDWWNPANVPDTVEFDVGTAKFFVKKTFYFDIEASGHDDLREQTGSGVKNWYYLFTRTDNLENQDLGRAGNWVAGPTVNVLDDRAEVTYRYELGADPGGGSLFDDPPGYWNADLEFSIYGRDTNFSDEFQQFMFLNQQKTLLNVYSVASLGRWTETGMFTFHLAVKR